MARSRILAAAAAGVIVIVVAPIAVLLFAGAVRAPAPPTGVASSAAPSVDAAEAQIRLEDIHWVYAPPPPAGAPVDSYALQAGTLEAEAPLVDLEVEWHADLGADLARQPPIGGPIRGAVAYIADDGTVSEVRRARIAAGGADELLAEFRAVVWDIAVAPDGGAMYAALVERADTERDLGVVRVLLDGSGDVEQVLPPAQLVGRGVVSRVAFIGFNVQLALSDDGRHLVRRACAGSEGCVVEILDLEGGLTHEVPEGEIVGVVAGAVVMRQCDVAGCAAVATDLGTGASVTIDGDPIGIALAHRGAPVLVVGDADDGARSRVVAIDLATGRQQVLYRAPDGATCGVDVHSHLELAIPDGFVHVTESITIGDDGAIVNVRQRELLVALDGRGGVEMPPAPFRPPPGFDRQG